MNAKIGKYHVMSTVVAVMATALTSCAHADSTVTASKEYVNRKVAAALDSVGVAMEDQWMATTNYVDSATNDVLVATQGYTDEKISSSSASATNYVDSATNDVLVAAQGYTDEKISEIPAADFSTNNVELVETIEATAPPPGDYAAVSNAAVYAAITNALQDAAITALGDGKVSQADFNTATNDINAALTNKASIADATLTEWSGGGVGFPAWVPAGNVVNPLTAEGLAAFKEYLNPPGVYLGTGVVSVDESHVYIDEYPVASVMGFSLEDLSYKVMLALMPPGASDWADLSQYIGVEPWSIVGVRNINGYVLGSSPDNPIAAEGEVAFLRSNKLDKFDVVAPSISSSASCKAADAKATGDALAGKVSQTDFNTATNDINTALANKASIADATLTEHRFSEWVCSLQGVSLIWGDSWSSRGGVAGWVIDGDQSSCIPKGSFDSLSVEWTGDEQTFDMSGVTATRTVLQGYQLGDQTDMPLASEAEAEALRTGKADKSDLDPLLFAQYYPDGNVKSAAEFTAGIKYDDPDTTNRTITVKPFCNTGTATNDNSSLVGRVVIPPFVDAQGNPYISDDGTRYKVVGMNYGWDHGVNTNLTSIVVPNTVTTIGRGAFDICDALASVSLPAATTIGDEVFGGCTNLTTVSLPAATTIGRGAFDICDALASVSLPAATTIGENAFRSCISLTSVSLPAATTIGISAFLACDALASVSLPAATTIEVGAFDDCSALASVSLPAATTIGSFNDCTSLTSVSLPAATTIEGSAFDSCTGLTTALLPAATTIEWYAFNNCTSLTSVSLPAATTVEASAFARCTSLASVDFGDTPRSSVPSLGEDAFTGVPTSCKIIVPDAQYNAWTAEILPDGSANPWHALVTDGYKFLRHSEWQYARKYELDGKLDKMESISWSALKSKRDGGTLVPGQQYRITNYVAAVDTRHQYARSANHPFDIIVVADATNVLREAARATQHTAATNDYFYGCSLSAWRIQYCLDNDESRFSWAVPDGQTDAVTGTGGRGVIYRMVDEFDNDVPYDFKGIQFIAYSPDDSDNVFRYTFDSGDNVDNTDCSINPTYERGAWGNKIGQYREGSQTVIINYIVFKGGYQIGNVIDDDCSCITFGANSLYNAIGRYGYNISFGSECHYNTLDRGATSCTFGNNCKGNFLGENCVGNALGNNCERNVFGVECQRNTLGSSCKENAFAAGCHDNTLGNSCNRNAMGPGCAAIAIKVNGNDNTFGSYCRYITLWDGSGRNSFGNGCESINVGKQFGGSCFNNSFDNGSNNIRIGNNSDNNHFGAGVNHVVFGSADTPAATSNYYSSVSVESGNRYIYLVCTTNVTSSAPYRNIAIHRGVNKTSTYKTIADPNGNQSFETVYRAAGSLDIEVQ